MRRQYSHRPAFTLTEMMVATGLILFIMAIISTAFRSGIDTFSKLNTTGKLQEQLGNAQRIIQRDLSADHFEPNPNGAGFSGPRLSDQRLDRVGWTPPNTGYFIAWQTKSPDHPLAVSNSKIEQGGLQDGEGILSSINTDSYLRFTVKLRTDTPPYDIPMYRFAQSTVAQVADRTLYPDSILDPLNSAFGSRQYFVTSNWAQVEYFLVPNPKPSPASPPVTTTGTLSGLKLYSLRRKIIQFPGTVPPDSRLPNSTVSSSAGAPLASRPTRVNSPLPAGYDPITKALGTGDDILLTNVLSFEMKFIWNAPNINEFTTLAKQPVVLNALTSPLNGQPVTASFAQNSTFLNDPTDWPFSDLPLDSSRITQPDGTTRTPNSTVAWPGVSGQRSWDEDPPLYFDTWYNPTTFAPTWSSPPADDRLNPMGGGINPAATLPNQPPLRIRIKAIQFKIRIWDDKTGQTRQITIMQEV